MFDSPEPHPDLTLFGEHDLRPARTAMRALAERLPFDTRQVADITLAVAEACVNGVRYGATQEDGSVVTVTAHQADDHLRIDVRDFGQGFEPPEPRMPNPLSESGRGIALIHALMDAVAITSTHTGTQVRMIKYFTR